MENRFPRDMYIKVDESGYIVSINFCCDFMSTYFVERKFILKRYFRDNFLFLPGRGITIKYCPNCGGKVYIDNNVPWE